MSLYLNEKSFLEKLQLIIKLIENYENNILSWNEIYYILDLLLNFDLIKDKNFFNTEILENIKNIINIDLAFYTNNIKDLEENTELFWDDKLRIILLKLKIDITNALNGN